MAEKWPGTSHLKLLAPFSLSLSLSFSLCLCLSHTQSPAHADAEQGLLFVTTLSALWTSESVTSASHGPMQRPSDTDILDEGHRGRYNHSGLCPRPVHGT